MYMVQYFNHLIFPNPLKTSTYSTDHSSHMGLMTPMSPPKTVFMWESLHHCSASTSREKTSSQLALSAAVGREDIFGQQICSKYKLLFIMFGMKLFWNARTLFSVGLVLFSHQLRNPSVSAEDSRKGFSTVWDQWEPPFLTPPRFHLCCWENYLVHVPLTLGTCETTGSMMSTTLFALYALQFGPTFLKGKNIYKIWTFCLYQSITISEEKSHFSSFE